MKLKSAIVAALAAAAVIHISCAWKWLAPPSKRAEINLKNRTVIPSASDFDPRVTLATMLQAGDDRRRWSTANAASVEGYVVRLHAAGVEAANCYSFTRRDTHIELALRLDAPGRERVIVEVTPPLREWAKTRGLDWSVDALKRDLLGRWVRFEGWLFFDSGHDEESENMRPGFADNWRATAWEIHPITSITVVSNRSGTVVSAVVTAPR